MSYYPRVRFNDTHTPPVSTPPPRAATQPVDDPDDLDTLPEHCFSTDFKLPDLSICTFYSPRFISRLEKFMSMHSVGGPLFALSSPPPVHGWRTMDDKYQVMTLGQRKIYFWSAAFVDTVAHGESEDFKEPFFRLVVKPMLAIQTQTLSELLGSYSSSYTPGGGPAEFVNVVGFEKVTHRIYDARNRFLFSGRLPRLSPDDIHPGDIVNVEFIIVQRMVEGRPVRELHVKAVYLLWTTPPSILRTRPSVADPGPTYEAVARKYV